MHYKSDKLLEDGLDTQNSVSSWTCIWMYTSQSARIFSKGGQLCFVLLCVVCSEKCVHNALLVHASGSIPMSEPL